MTEISIKPIVLSVYQVINEAHYIIPIYQRNYAWTKAEIEQLLVDIYHQFKADAESQFYIGTLTVKAREADLFEVIDGQQRHTTLNLIKAVIRHDYNQIVHGNLEPNLSFEARKLSDDYIALLMTDFTGAINSTHPEVSIQNLQAGCRDIRRFFKSSYIPEPDTTAYLNYLLSNVMIIRVPVPSGTDLNHYFEIMNSRGEQLEQHEILKAEFISRLQLYSGETRATFAEIWDACSQMDRYLPFNFDPGRRSSLFGPEYKTINRQVLIAEEKSDQSEIKMNSDSGHSLLNTLEHHVTVAIDPAKRLGENSRFRSIIDFPNFLLQVLQEFYPAEVISLDDKNLLKEFGCTAGSSRKLPEPVAFINFLFFLRTCFDRYVIKREEGSNDWNWKIFQINSSNNSYVNTFSEQRDLIMIQGMYHVTQPANTYKNWLSPLMRLFNRSASLEAIDMVTFLQKQANKQMEKHLEHLDSGTQTPLFCFNLLDYKLWRIYYRLQQNEQVIAPHQITVKIAQLSGVFQSFRFTQNNSVEHVAPQNPMENEVKVERIDEFGNLCLISRSSNSRLINLPFLAKKAYFSNENRRSVESLKQAIIFTYSDWGDDEIKQHGNIMKDLLVDSNW